MGAFGRRTFMAGVGAAAGAVAVAGVAGRAVAEPTAPRPGRIPVRREEHRVVVIGSGFGGGVTALRLTQAGVPVTMLERGRRWATGPNANTFATPTDPDKRMLWYRSAPTLFGRPLVVDPYVGLIEAVAGENMSALCAAGLGGGSLVYQGMTLQPKESVFYTQFPSRLDYEVLARTYYPRVASMLRIETAPDALIDSPQYLAPRVFRDHCIKAGLPVSKIPMPIDWSYALAELRGEMRPSYTNGMGAIGVNNGGKHSVDVTYIKQAEATGKLDLRLQHEVTDVIREKDGRWTVRANRISSSGQALETVEMTTRALVMAAGTMNTTKLLMRAQAHDTVPDLPAGLGTGWGSNGDRIYTWTDFADAMGAQGQGGPVVFGSLDWDGDPRRAATVIQASIPTLGTDPRTTMMVGYGVSDARGKFVWDRAQDQAVLRWPRNGDHVLQDTRITPLTKRIAGPSSVLFDTFVPYPSTWHPLGGAPMDVVCDLQGRVNGHRGLYVLDGALMPGNTAACNPSMTIAAIAEWAIDQIIPSDVGTVF
ncbi:GMC oxidoreductase [Williamsia serinedens]|nr:GMC oxidoreductase [Williamsia serinedens]